jgi:nitroreductase
LKQAIIRSIKKVNQLLQLQTNMNIQTIKDLFPDKAKEKWHKIKAYKALMIASLEDFNRFVKYSGTFKRKYTQDQLESIITIDYHRLEKGLSMEFVRPGFGSQATFDLQTNMFIYANKFGLTNIWFEAFTTLEFYYNSAKRQNSLDEKLFKQFTELKTLNDTSKYKRSTPNGGIENVTREDIYKCIDIDYKAFAESRHSIRHFSDVDINMDKIYKAAEIAQLAPSVCNRQPWHLYVLTEKANINELLTRHGGARGFDHNVNKILVVTVDLQNFHYQGERNEAWIDGGIYTQALLNSLHHLAIGTCCLNWCVNKMHDQWLRNLIDISKSSVIICLIAIGELPKKFNVPVSPRKDISTVLTVK